MLFNSFIFLFAFLPVCYLVFWSLRTASSRYVWLTLSGYVFYGYWNPWFCLLMAFSTLVSFLAGLGFLRWTSDERKRRLCLVIPIVIEDCKRAPQDAFWQKLEAGWKRVEADMKSFEKKL